MAANKQGKMVSSPASFLYSLQSFSDSKLIMIIAKSRKQFCFSSLAPPGVSASSKVEDKLTQSQINYRMRITLNDGRQMTGQMLAFDKVWHMVGWPRSQTDECDCSI